MKIKKILSIVLAGVMAMALLTGCGSSKNSQSPSSNNQSSASTEAPNETTENAAESTTGSVEANTTENATEADTTADNNTTGSTGKTLVVYYSATGTTKGVAEKIAEETGADIFAIEPKVPYSDDDLDWTNDDSRVSREHDNEDERDVPLVTTTVDNWDSYDTVFIGYPIWWGIAAWPVNNFVKNNDFTGKKVITFCTAASSGIGDSGNLLKEMAGTGDWQDGERLSEDEVQSWVRDNF
nr:flavodoxin [uncultured Anaerobutyricum sp.]